jgi:hypothetical protein
VGAAANGVYPTPHAPSWRFDVGERVACKVGDDSWQVGTVEMRDEPDPEAYPGFALLPYVVRSDGGRLVSAPEDTAAFIVAEEDMPAEETDAEREQAYAAAAARIFTDQAPAAE